MAENCKVNDCQQNLLRAEIVRLEAALENEAIITRELRKRVKLLGEIGEVCVYDDLGEICDFCRCQRRLPQDAVAISSGERTTS